MFMPDIDIHDLKLHESTEQAGYTITKVPNGWLYSAVDINNAVFINNALTMLPLFLTGKG